MKVDKLKCHGVCGRDVDLCDCEVGGLHYTTPTLEDIERDSLISEIIKIYGYSLAGFNPSIWEKSKKEQIAFLEKVLKNLKTARRI